MMPKYSFSQIKKRDGRVVDFDESRIIHAILKAMEASLEGSKSAAEKITQKVLAELLKRHKKEGIPEVEEIQDIVETCLILEDFPKTAKAYILYRREHEMIRDEKRTILGGLTTTLPFTANALKIIAARYLGKNPKGEVIEIPEQMFERIAKSLAQVELEYGKSEEEVQGIFEDFLEIMVSFKYTPAGRTLTNAGAPTPLIPNCIVLHMDDSMDGIFTTLREAALLQQAGSGLGFPFHLLRPANTRAKRSRGVASGPISFLEVYNQAFGVIKQQGRHGANMAVMRVDHPDVVDFIHCKEKEGRIHNFNISVALTDEFMKQVLEDSKEPWLCEYGGVKTKPRITERDDWNNFTSMSEVTITARELLYEIVSAAWLNGEPGIIFIDRVNQTNPLPGLGRIEACNPCGEQFLHDGDVCNLGSINLEKFVRNGKIEWQELKRVTKTAVRLMDNVVDLTHTPVERVNRAFKGSRRIGLGIMGFADMLYLLKIPYNSQEGFETAEKVMKAINEAADEASQVLAQEKGVFPAYEKSIFPARGIRRRNAALTTIAPTGSISMMFDVASGLEPYFALAYSHKIIAYGRDELYFFNKHLERELKARGLWSEELAKEVYEKGTIQHIDLPEDMKKVYVTAMDITAEDHIRMQGAFQKHVDNSISKTINFPNNASKEDVLKGYMLAWEVGCKSCTVYRDKSRELQILNLNSNDLQSVKNIDASAEGEEVLITTQSNNVHLCPECKNEMRAKEGCFVCEACGTGLCA